jgi:hypothetical protein
LSSTEKLKNSNSVSKMAINYLNIDVKPASKTSSEICPAVGNVHYNE